MAALIQPVSDIFHMISEDFRSSQYLNDMEKQQDRPKNPQIKQNKKQKSKQTGIFENWLESQWLQRSVERSPKAG